MKEKTALALVPAPEPAPQNSTEEPGKPFRPDRPPSRIVDLSLDLPAEQRHEITRRICIRIADGEFLETICADKKMPTRYLFHCWRCDDPVVAAMVTRAEEARFHLWAEEIISLGDLEPRNMKDTKNESRMDPTWVSHHENLTNNRKWIVSRVLRKLYGDKLPTEKSEPDYSPPAPTPEEVRERMNRLSPFLHKWANSV